MSTPRTGRGRPRTDPDAPPLSRDSIAAAAFELAADSGLRAVTMRALAERLGVTVRALYNHVEDRQEVVDLVARQIVELQRDRPLDAAEPQESIRKLYASAREAYRKAGRAVLFALDETVTPGAVPVDRFLLPERMLAFLTEAGLSLADAVAWRGRFLLDGFAFGLLMDYRWDRASPEERAAMGEQVPRPWLDAHPEVEVPLTRASLELSGDIDDFFATLVERAVRDFEALRRA